MDKKPLIGVSICAVVLLVLSSLTNVVGYQSVKSSAVNDSPLFKTRTQRAINQQQNIITSQYLGMGKGNLMQFPTKDNKTVLLKNIFESMKKMNDATFQKFLTQVKQRLIETKSLNEIQLLEVNNGLTELRNQADLPIQSPSKMHTYACAPTSYSLIECIKFFLLFFLLLPIVIICGISHYLFPGTFPSLY